MSIFESNGHIYRETIIHGVYFCVDNEKGRNALNDFNKIYSLFKPGKKLLEDIREAKKNGYTKLIYTQV